MAAVAVPAPIEEHIIVENKVIQGPDNNDSLRLRIYKSKSKRKYTQACYGFMVEAMS